MLLSRARERDVVGNTIPENMAGAEVGLEQLSGATVRGVGGNRVVGDLHRAIRCEEV